jgi:hypothetical protein
MTQFYAYIYRDPSRNFQPIYVGKGQGKRSHSHLNNRDKPHKKENKSFMGRLRKMKEIGIEPVIQIFNCESEELAHLFEEEAIDKYGRIDLGKGSLFNHTNGGEGTSGRIASVETRQKMSIARKGKSPSPETRQKLSDANKGEKHLMFGKSLSAAYRQKISETMKGKSRSPETRQKISDAQKGIPRPCVTCPHCGKEGKTGSMHRWHFDNCKYKK